MLISVPHYHSFRAVTVAFTLGRKFESFFFLVLIKKVEVNKSKICYLS